MQRLRSVAAVTAKEVIAAPDGRGDSDHIHSVAVRRNAGCGVRAVSPATDAASVTSPGSFDI